MRNFYKKKRGPRFYREIVCYFLLFSTVNTSVNRHIFTVKFILILDVKKKIFFLQRHIHFLELYRCRSRSIMVSRESADEIVRDFLSRCSEKDFFV
jgi:hypothetical protein